MKSLDAFLAETKVRVDKNLKFTSTAQVTNPVHMATLIMTFRDRLSDVEKLLRLVEVLKTALEKCVLPVGTTCSQQEYLLDKSATEALADAERIING